MLKIFTKIKKQIKFNDNQKGMTLVIAITVMTLLLSISLSISNIVLRQIRITNTTNASKPAFFIADSGIECAFHYDTKYIEDPDSEESLNLNADFQQSIFGASPIEFVQENVRCGEGDGQVLGLSKEQTSSSPETFVTKFDINYGQTCAKVEVIKTEVSTKINSYGYNTDSGQGGCNLTDISSRRLVERGLTITY